MFMIKDVTDCGNLQSEGTRNGKSPPFPVKDTLFTFANHGVYSKNLSGTQSYPPIQTRKSLT